MSFSTTNSYAEEFSFHVRYEKRSPPVVSIQGHAQYFGLQVHGSEGGFFADISEAIKSGTLGQRLGRDAISMQAALLKLPDFTSAERLRAEMFG